MCIKSFSTKATTRLSEFAFVLLAVSFSSCKSRAPAPETAPESPTAAAPAAEDTEQLRGPKKAPANTEVREDGTKKTPAKLGQKAPDFELRDLEGNAIKLSEHRGKIVVLEWFNPECPFVQKSHTKGSLVDTASRHQKQAVVWLAINSGAEGKQGHGADLNREAKQRFKLTHPVLLDESGKVGKLYGAERTPHMYVIDDEGVLVYAGAIDNSPDGEGESPTGDELVNYVDEAIAAINADRQPEVSETKAYGCGVKYGS